MKKLEIERMSRLEEMVERLEQENKSLKSRLENAFDENLKLQGKNEALLEVVSTLSKKD